MKSELTLRTSLGLNLAAAVLVIFLGAERSRRSPGPGSADSQHPTPRDSASAATASKQYSLAHSPPASASRRKSIIDRLRDMGAPNDLLALVARVDFEAQWDRRFADCAGDMNKLAAVQLEMNMAKDAAMRAALGEKGFREWDQKYMLWEAMSTKVDVTPAEASAIYNLKKKLQQEQFRVEQARLDGTMDDAAINAEYDKDYSEYYQNLKSVLGDERYAKSQQLDTAFVAGNLEHELAAVHPTDEQLQQLLKVEQAWKQSQAELDHQFQNDPSSPDYAAKAKALQEAHSLEYQRILGSNAFETLQMEQDPAYSQMKRYESLWGLDDGKITQVYSAIKQFRSDVAAYQSQVVAFAANGQAPDANTVQQHLQQLATETQQSLLGYIGQNSLNKLQRNRIFGFQSGQPSRSGSF